MRYILRLGLRSLVPLLVLLSGFSPAGAAEFELGGQLAQDFHLFSKQEYHGYRNGVLGWGGAHGLALRLLVVEWGDAPPRSGTGT